MTILAIETSCDDTAAAVLRNNEVLSNVISSQDVHNLYGGIVPELASREHVKGIAPIVQAALVGANVKMSEVDAIAVTNGPGLPGSLLVGCHFAKGLALRHNLPLYAIHHIEAHLYSGYLEDPTLVYPSVCLVVSGGHTSIFYVESPSSYSVLGSTKDDAAGEAFDKVAKMIGLGYPGGPHIDRLAKKGNAEAFAFPRGLMNEESFDFSFSGLKTAVRRTIDELRRTGQEVPIADVCASAQRAIVDVLVLKTMKAVRATNARAVTIAGGVSANSELRSRLSDVASSSGLRFVAPRMGYCVDNAAMIGYVAALRSAEPAASATDEFTISPKALRSKFTP